MRAQKFDDGGDGEFYYHSLSFIIITSIDILLYLYIGIPVVSCYAQCDWLLID